MKVATPEPPHLAFIAGRLIAGLASVICLRLVR
jgi:hypothetical protein